MQVYNKYKIIIWFILAGLAFWLFDTTLDYFVFYKGTFHGLLITNVPAHEIYIRVFAFVIFLLAGFIFLKQSKKINLFFLIQFD